MSNSGGNGKWTANGGGGSNAAGTLSYVRTDNGFEISAKAVNNQGTGYIGEQVSLATNIGGRDGDLGRLELHIIIRRCR